MKSPIEQRGLFEKTFDEVLQKAEQLLIPYKRKENGNIAVEVLTRIDNEAAFLPLLRVTDKNGNVKAEQELRRYGRDEFISQIGTITIGKSSVRISPRKNWYADYYELTPIKLQW